MGEIFIGSEALDAGALTEYALRRFHQRILPDVYAPRHARVTLRDRSRAAWLWSGRTGVLAGLAAAALHHARWVDETVPIELIAASARRHPGLIVRNDTVLDDEIARAAGLPVTTPARTAFDLGRRLPRDDAVARLDALRRATAFSAADVRRVMLRHTGARGIRQLRQVLALVDGGAASPKETWLRLLLVDAGLPRPTTQIPVADDRGIVGALDMGWKELRVAAEYDGDQHRSDRRQYVKDQKRLRRLEAQGWIVVRVIKEDPPHEVVDRVTAALRRRGYRRAS
jgi:hypothetical protein